MLSVLEWLSTWSWAILFILGLAGIVAYTSCCEQLMFDLSVCVLTSAIFYIFVTFLPYYFMKKQREKVICKGFYKLNEALRLCKNSIYSPFDLNVKPDEKKEADYIRDFEKTNFNDYWVQPQNRYQKFEEERIRVKNIAEYLQLQPFLSLKQQKIISDILSSILANDVLRPIPHDLSERDRIFYHNNQKEMGKCVFRLYALTLM